MIFQKKLGLALIATGFYLTLTNLSLTGSVVGSSDFSGWLSFLGFFSFIAGCLMVLMSGQNNLERLLRNPSLGWTQNTEEGNWRKGNLDLPIIVDTNYIINASKTKDETKKLLGALERRYALGYPLVVAESVLDELRPYPKDGKIIEDRKKEIKRQIKEKGITLENYSPEWEEVKDQYLAQATQLLQRTPKAQNYRFFTDNPEGGNWRNYFQNLGETPHKKFVIKYNEMIKELRRGKNINQLLRGYNTSLADTEILAYSMYLAEKGRVYNEKERKDVGILSSDPDLEFALENLATENQELAENIILGQILKFPKK